MTDPIADLLTRIRNAGQRKIKTVVVPTSKMKEQLVSILKVENFIVDYEIVENEITGFKDIVMELKYVNGKFTIENLTRISKPGIRRYVRYQQIPRVLGGIGIAVMSTSKGVMTGTDARKAKIGGELLCTIY